MEGAREKGLEVPAYWKAGAFPQHPTLLWVGFQSFSLTIYCLSVSCRDLPIQLSLTGQCVGQQPWLVGRGPYMVLLTAQFSATAQSFL